MARASKVRFVAKVSGGFRELLSVTERKDGSLIVVPKGGSRADKGSNDKQQRDIKNQKYSVHATLDALDGGTLLHQTTMFSDGGKYETHAYTLAIKNGQVWPLYLHHFLHPGAKVTAAARVDQKIIANYDPDKSTLIFGVFVGPAHASPDSVQDSEIYTRHVANFHRFSIIVLVAFSGMRSMPMGFLNHLSTSSAVIDGSKVGDLLIAPDRGLSPNVAGFYAETQLFGIHAQAWVRHFEPLGEEIAAHDPLWLFIGDRIQQGLSRNANGVGSVSIGDEDRMISLDDPDDAARTG